MKKNLIRAFSKMINTIRYTKELLIAITITVLLLVFSISNLNAKLFTRATLVGNVKIEQNETAEYDVTAGLGWNIVKNSLYTRLAVNNNDGYDYISGLLKFDLTNPFWTWLYPFAVSSIDSIDGNFRFMYGIGVGIKIFKDKPINLGFDISGNMTHDVGDTKLPGSLLWWRARGRLNIKLSSVLSVGIDFVYSHSASSQIFLDNSIFIEFKINKYVSIITEKINNKHNDLAPTSVIVSDANKLEVKVKIHL